MVRAFGCNRMFMMRDTSTQDLGRAAGLVEHGRPAAQAPSGSFGLLSIPSSADRRKTSLACNRG